MTGKGREILKGTARKPLRQLLGNHLAQLAAVAESFNTLGCLILLPTPIGLSILSGISF
jgi:hypothetical protein